MLRKKLLLIVLNGLFLSGGVLFAQQMVRVDRSEFKTDAQGFDQAWKALQEGDQFFLKGSGNYVMARAKYLEASDYNQYNARLNYKVGICYLFTDHKMKALPYLLTSFEGDPLVTKDIHYFLGLAYQYNYRFDSAAIHYQTFLDQADKKMLKTLGDAARNHIRECCNGEELIKDTLRVEISDMGPAINSPYDDYKLILSSTNRHMFYTSRRPSTGKELPNLADGKFNEDIYQSFVVESGWEAGQRMNPPLNSKYNDAALAFSPDDQELYIYRGNKKHGNILVSKNVQGNWSRPINASRTINSRAKETSVFIAPDSSLILFVSDHKKLTRGGKDIFVIYPDKEGGWTDPEPLDSTINTPYDEEGPYLSEDGNTLYFSSKGHNSMGGYDLFTSERVDSNTWSTPKNMGFPLSTPDDDLFFVPTADTSIAYVSGIRETSQGLMDLYVVHFIPPPVDTIIPVDTTPVVDTVHVVVTDTVQVMDTLQVVPPKPKVNPLVVKGLVIDDDSSEPLIARIEFIDLSRNEVVKTTISDRNTGAYQVSFENKKSYGVEVNAPGYMFMLDMLPEPLKDDTLLIRNFMLKKVQVGASVVLNNIFFDFNKATLTPASFPELETVIKFMESNPSIRVEIDGHTDNVGSAAYNLKLSEERAKSVARYLIQHGVDASRILYKGFGFSNPIATNETEEGRAKNRRVEFKIVGM